MIALLLYSRLTLLNIFGSLQALAA